MVIDVDQVWDAGPDLINLDGAGSSKERKVLLPFLQSEERGQTPACTTSHGSFSGWVCTFKARDKLHKREGTWIEME